MTDTHLIPQEEFIKFITAGNATVTVKSVKTGNRFTYKITAGKNEDILFVNLLTGSDNNSDFSYLCHIKKAENGYPTLFSKPNKFTTPGYIAFQFVWMNTLLQHPMNNLEIWHEGRCCRCGRKLTVPESIESGIGPECAGKLNKFSI